MAQKIGGLLVAPGKASADWFSWVVIFEALFVCHDILILGKVPGNGGNVPT